MEFEHRGGGAPNREPTPSEANRPDQNQPTLEMGEGRHGVPPPQGEQSQPQQEGGERQPLPGVWDVLECRARIHEARSSNRMTSQEYDREMLKLNRLKREQYEKGTTRDKLILDLSTAITIEPGNLPVPITFRHLSLVVCYRDSFG